MVFLPTKILNKTSARIVLASLLLAPSVWAADEKGSPTIVLKQGVPELDGAIRRPESADAHNYDFGVGDKLKIVIHEQIEVEENKFSNQRRARSEPNYILREDLSGNYEVQFDGSIVLPLIGEVPVRNRSKKDIITDVSSLIRKTVGRSAQVNVTVVERQPIVVLGSVKASGSYKYIEDMMVLHAVGLAGGLQLGSNDMWSQVEAARERSKLRATLDRLKRLLAETAVLQAEMYKRPVAAPDQLLKLSTAAEADSLIATEKVRRTRVMSLTGERRKSLTLANETARRTLASVRERRDPINTNVQMRSLRLAALQKLSERGSVTNQLVMQAQSELSEAQERQITLEGLIAEAELRQSTSEQDLIRFDIDVQVDLDRLLESREREVEELRTALLTSESVLGAVSRDGVPDREAYTENSIAYEVVRRTTDGYQTLRANPRTRLMPGDVVNVTRPEQMQVSRE